MKKRFKKIYRKLFYSFFKTFERRMRNFLFLLFETFLPRFNSFRYFGVPRGVLSIPGEIILPSKNTIRTIPSTLDIDLLSQFFPSQVETSGGKITVLKNGFSTETAATLTAKGHLVPEFTEQFTMSDIYRHKLFTFRLNRCFSSIPHFDGKLATLTVDGQWNYYHWLFDALPKLHLMQKKGIIPDKYYADISKPFQKESFTLLGISETQVISPLKHPIISATSLIATSFPCLQNVPEWVCTFLKETFASEGKRPLNKAGKRLFISRKDASYRRILNEKELLPLLEREGFTTIQPEYLSFQEQIGLFQSADLILAPHGAGLANLVFCKNGTRVIEIFPPRFPCTCYWALSNLVGLNYTYLKGIDDKITYSSECEGYDHIIIDTQKVKKVLESVF